MISSCISGLRVSQFNEEKATALDPTQKSITNFVVLGDALQNNICSSGGLGLSVKGDSFENSNGGDVNSEQDPDYVRKDVFNSDQLSDFSFSSCSVNEHVTCMEHFPLSNIQAEVCHICGLSQLQFLRCYYDIVLLAILFE